MTMKALKMYLVALLVVFITASLMYAVAKIGARRDARARDDRIKELEDALTECQAVYKEMNKCFDMTEELIKWKELAEQCIDTKLAVPGQ